MKGLLQIIMKCIKIVFLALPVNSFRMRTCSTSQLGFEPALSWVSRRLVMTPKLLAQNEKWMTHLGMHIRSVSP